MKKLMILLLAVLLCVSLALPAFAEAATAAPMKGFHWLRNLIISLVVGLIVALIATSVMKGKLRSVYKQNAAASYVREDSFEVQKKKDMYLYSTTQKTAKPKSNDSN